MAILTTGSSNISSFDIRATADLCGGNFIFNTSPSVFISTGNLNVLGVKIKIENPYGVEIKSYGVGYDIAPPMSANFSFPIPTVDGNFEYGNYKVTAELFDAGGKSWELIKNLNPCQPDLKNKNLKYGSIIANIEDDCKNGKVYIKVNEPPVYKGFISESKTQSYTLTYPSSSLTAPLTTTQPSFSVDLFQGEYLVVGDVCATYNANNNIYYKVPYKVNCKKPVSCLVDTCAVAYKLAQFDEQLNSCSDEVKSEVTNKIFDTLRLLSTIEWAKQCGQSVGDYIEQLELLLGITCTCSITDGTPIIDNSPSKDFVINGCNVSKTTVGLTDTYTINNYSYKVTANPAQNIVSISAPQLNGCEYVQQIEFDINNLYTAVKGKVVSLADWTFWADTVKKAYTPTNNQLACMGLNISQWNALSYADSQALIWNKLCACCSTCNAIVSALTETKEGANVRLNWTNNADVKYVEIYLNGIFEDTVISPIATYLLLGAANGNANTAKIISKCADDSIGNELNLSFTEAGCPIIAAPLGVENPPETDYACPFNLNTLLTLPAPVGLTYEWHNANNTSNSSLVANPTAVVNGNYFIFLKDVNGCYSSPVQVVVNCRSIDGCSEPQNLIAVKKFGVIQISFQSATFPPPANSYTVKRRLASAPDISGSYTTIGTPVFNVVSGNWEISDNTFANDTLYVYRAISNCTSGGLNTDYQYAFIPCPTPTLTPSTNSIGYSVVPNGGQVSEIKVEVYDNTETTLINSATFIPVFANPITGTISSLVSGTTYKFRFRIKIGTYEKICPFQSVTTS